MNSIATPTLRILILTLAVLMLLPACKRYDEGPVISFASRESRLANDWEARQILRNQFDETVLYEYIQWQFRDNGEFTWEQKLVDEPEAVTLEGQWAFISLDRQVRLTYRDENANSDRELLLDIKRLTGDELWIDYFFEGDYYALQLR